MTKKYYNPFQTFVELAKVLAVDETLFENNFKNDHRQIVNRVGSTAPQNPWCGRIKHTVITGNQWNLGMHMCFMGPLNFSTGGRGRSLNL